MATPQTPSMAYSPEHEPANSYSRSPQSLGPRTPDDLAWITGPSTVQGPFEQQERTPASTPRQSPIQGHDNFWNAFQFGISNEATFGGPIVHYTLLHPFARYPEAIYNPPFLGNLSSKAGYPFAQEFNNCVPDISQHVSVHVASPLFNKNSGGRTIEPKKLQHGGIYERNHAYSANHASTSTSIPPESSELDCFLGFTGKTGENESESDAESITSWPSPHLHTSSSCSSSLLSSSGSCSHSSCSSPSSSVVSSPSSGFTLSSRESSPSDSWSSDSEDDGCSEIDEYIPARAGSSATFKRKAVNCTPSNKGRVYPKSSTSNVSNRVSSVSPEISIDSDSDDDDEFIPAHATSSARAAKKKSSSTSASAARLIKKPKRFTLTDDVDHGEAQADAAKRFTCTFPGCHRLFTRLFNMRTHERTHNPNQERPFICSEPSCAKRFSRKHDMQRHEASVHRGEGRYGCPICDKSFARRDGLQKHQAGHGGPCHGQ
ncbi:hypothetical protein BGZ82_003642 [Podila clonocystis]|nr:hypothetical protein BGZ82_003642 [Podila clonocystis]